MFITRARLFFSAFVSAAFPAISQYLPDSPDHDDVPFAVGGQPTHRSDHGRAHGKDVGTTIIVENVTWRGQASREQVGALPRPTGYMVASPPSARTCR